MTCRGAISFSLLSLLTFTSALTAGCADNRSGDDSVVPDATPGTPDATPGTPDAGTTAAVCGNGVREAAEACDDGNTVAGDCCTEACAAVPGCETETNDTSATADPVATHFIDDVVTGFIAPVGDVDYYLLDLPASASEYTLHLETVDGPLSTCASDHIDSLVGLEDASGTLLDENDDGSGLCSLLDRSVGPGTYFVRVSASATAQPANTSFDYRLRLTATPVICGDHTRAGAEGCDDGNTASGDGCSADCHVEALPEVEPNGTSATATGPLSVPGRPAQGAIDPIGDVDFFSFVVPRRADVRLETFDLTGVGNCADGVDTIIRLYGPDGTTLLAENDDGDVGRCSAITGAAYPEALHLAPGTYYVSVSEYQDDGLVPGYLLYLNFDALCGDGTVQGSEECDATGALCTADCERVPVCGDGHIDGTEQCDDSNTAPGDGCSATCQRERVCGDGFVESGEQCDDGNTSAGDGCSATCTIEAGHFFEVEPNNTFAAARLAPVGTRMHGAVSPAGDIDYFSFKLTAPASVHIQTYDGAATLDSCAGADTVLTLYGSDGTTVLATNDDGANNAPCSTLDPAADPEVMNLPAGTYFVEVEEYQDDDVIPAYQVIVTIQ